jgi:putative FmdB family regulatory protein
MPIYAYRCAACGHAQDVLQKLSDPVLTVCPACGAESYAKQLTAAGFQLKGSGWYVTDFRGGGGAARKDGDADTPAADKAAGDPAVTDDKPATADKVPSEKPAAKVAETPAAAPAPAPAPAKPAAHRT